MTDCQCLYCVLQVSPSCFYNPNIVISIDIRYQAYLLSVTYGRQYPFFIPLYRIYYAQVSSIYPSLWDTHFCYHFSPMQICTTCLFIRAIYAYRDLNFTFLLHFLLHLVRALRSRPLPLVLTYSFSLVIFIYLLAAWTPHSPNSNLPFRPVMTLPGFT